MHKKTLYIFKSKVVKFHLTKALNYEKKKQEKTLSVQFDEMIIFGGLVFVFQNFWDLYSKSNVSI